MTEDTRTLSDMADAGRWRGAASLIIYSSYDSADELKDFVQLEPDKAWTKGEASDVAP